MAGRWNKKLDVWTIRNGGTTYEVVVRGVKEGRGQPIKSFEAECPALDVRVENPNLESLRTAIEAAINEAKRIDWKRYLVVRIAGDCEERDWPDEDDGEPRREHFEDSISSSFHYETIEAGQTPDGQHVHRDVNVGHSGATETYGRTENGTLEKYLRRNSYHGDGDRQVAAIEWTPERLAALIEIRGAFINLNRQLFRLLHPDRVAATLENTAMSVRLLTVEAPESPENVDAMDS